MNAVRTQRAGLIIGAALSAFAVAGLGALITDLGPWYYSLNMPSWKPPDGLFAPAWTTIFALTATSGVIALSRAPRGSAQSARMLTLFAINAVLNVAWSVLFFRLHRPDWAVLEVVLLWLSIAALMIATAKVSRLASALLIPYLAWVTFASALNYTIVRLNAPFGG